MRTIATVHDRVDVSERTGLLALGDVLAISAFVIVGQIHHGYDPVAIPHRVIGVLVPFLVGWIVVAPALGLYQRDGPKTFAAAAIETFSAWFGAAIIGLALRATSVLPGEVHWSFVVVTFVVGGTFVTGWRVLAVVATGH